MICIYCGYKGDGVHRHPGGFAECDDVEMCKLRVILACFAGTSMMDRFYPLWPAALTLVKARGN